MTTEFPGTTGEMIEAASFRDMVRGAFCAREQRPVIITLGESESLETFLCLQEEIAAWRGFGLRVELRIPDALKDSLHRALELCRTGEALPPEVVFEGALESVKDEEPTELAPMPKPTQSVAESPAENAPEPLFTAAYLERLWATPEEKLGQTCTTLLVKFDRLPRSQHEMRLVESVGADAPALGQYRAAPKNRLWLRAMAALMSDGPTWAKPLVQVTVGEYTAWWRANRKNADADGRAQEKAERGAAR